MKNKIEVNAEVTYLPSQSNIPGSQYAFAYTITITNHGETGAQLRTRRWLIQDETGQIEEVVGEGVVGQQPYLSPGESFEYSSGAIIKGILTSWNIRLIRKISYLYIYFNFVFHNLS